MTTRLRILAAASLMLAAAPASSQAGYAVPRGTITGALAARVLGVQNRERQLVGHVPLVWDPTLAAAAASYGPTLARLHQLIHSPRQSRPGQRENLAMAPHGARTPEQLVSVWTAEKRYAMPGIFPNISRTGNWMDVGHYAQMIWPTTTRVGCAFYEADTDYLICRYSPPGNVDGRPLYVPFRAPVPAAVPQVRPR